MMLKAPYPWFALIACVACRNPLLEDSGRAGPLADPDTGAAVMDSAVEEPDQVQPEEQADEADPLYALDDIYFGELHAHTAFSADAFLGMTAFYHGHLSEYGEETRDATYAYDHALEVTELDFLSLNDHAEGQTPSELIYPRGYGDYRVWQLPENWDLYLEQTRNYEHSCEATGGQEPCLVLFAGFEYTGETYGHKNVVWKHPDLVPDGRFAAWDDVGSLNIQDIIHDGVDAILYDVEDCTNPDDLWAWGEQWVQDLKATNPERADDVDYLTIVHTPGEAPVHDTDWDYTNAERLRLVEVYSKHGNSMGPDDVYEPVPEQDPSKTYLTKLEEWVRTGDEDLQLGVVAATDTHAGKPGNDTIDPDAVEYISDQMFFGGGLTGVVAPEKCRDAIWGALQARRSFGTTGPKIRLLLEARSGERSAWQGEVVEAGADSEWELRIAARSDLQPRSGSYQPLDRVEIWRDGESGVPLCVVDMEGQEEGAASCELELDEGERSAVLAVAVLVDGERAWTSPIFFE